MVVRPTSIKHPLIMLTKICTLAILLKVTDTKLEPKVVKGERGDIMYYSHSANLHVSCSDGDYICGASILNQKVLLTAAHCVEIDSYRCIDALIYTGHANKWLGEKNKLSDVMVHEKYDKRGVNHDIGLILVEKPLKLGGLIKRIVILRSPPWKGTAVIAGWGLINEIHRDYTDYLHYAELKVWKFEECQKIISSLPRGCLCGGKYDGQSYASEGDSGSALVVNNFIQIGLVSYKRPDISRSVVAFTNVSYYYDWIRRNSKRLHCTRRKRG